MEENKSSDRLIVMVTDNPDLGYQFTIGAGTSIPELASICGFMPRMLFANNKIESIKDFLDMVIQYATNELYDISEEEQTE